MLKRRNNLAASYTRINSQDSLSRTFTRTTLHLIKLSYVWCLVATNEIIQNKNTTFGYSKKPTCVCPVYSIMRNPSTVSRDQNSGDQHTEEVHRCASDPSQGTLTHPEVFSVFKLRVEGGVGISSENAHAEISQKVTGKDWLIFRQCFGSAAEWVERGCDSGNTVLLAPAGG